MRSFPREPVWDATALLQCTTPVVGALAFPLQRETFVNMFISRWGVNDFLKISFSASKTRAEFPVFWQLKNPYAGSNENEMYGLDHLSGWWTRDQSRLHQWVLHHWRYTLRP